MVIAPAQQHCTGACLYINENLQAGVDPSLPCATMSRSMPGIMNNDEPVVGDQFGGSNDTFVAPRMPVNEHDIEASHLGERVDPLCGR
jgi:hypothetical protein